MHGAYCELPVTDQYGFNYTHGSRHSQSFITGWKQLPEMFRILHSALYSSHVQGRRMHFYSFFAPESRKSNTTSSYRYAFMVEIR